jgi:hypothetical protein
MYDLGYNAHERYSSRTQNQTEPNKGRTYFKPILTGMSSSAWGEMAAFGLMTQCDKIQQTLQRNMFKYAYLKQLPRDSAYDEFTNAGDLYTDGSGGACSATSATCSMSNANKAKLPSMTDWTNLIQAKRSRLTYHTPSYGAFSSYFSRVMF